MTSNRRELFRTWLEDGRAARRAGRLDEAFGYFERAHIAGQPWVIPHLIAHWEMLRVGMVRRDPREVVGQIARLFLVGPGTLLGRLPEGNTGSARVNPFRPMPLDDEMRRLLELPMPGERRASG
jgi:hypothetical protein